MRVAWLSDTHLDFVSGGKGRHFVDQVAAHAPDAVVVGGDIADGWTVLPALERFATRIECPTYFVLGNHDFYHRGIAAVRAAVHDVVRGTRLVYLSDARVTELCPGVAIVGHDGWADGRNGDYTGSTFRPNDFVHIQDFQVFDRKEQRLRLMQDLAAQAATHFAEVLPQAAAAYPHVIALTHVPPFAAAARYRGRPATDDVQPFYSSRCVGEVILETMARHPSCRLTVLAGHTHAAARFNAAPNVEIRTASAIYGRPRIAGWLAADGSGVR